MASNSLTANRWNSILFLAYLFMLLGPVYSLFAGIEDKSISVKSSDSLAYNVIWLTLYLYLSIFIVLRPHVFIEKLTHEYFVIGFLISALFSYALFPPSAASPIIKFVSFMFTISFGLVAVILFPLPRIFRSFNLVGPLILLLHWAAYPIYRDVIEFDGLGRLTVFGTEPYGGMFGHKNLAGAAFAVLIVCAFNSPFKRLYRVNKNVWLGLYTISLLATGAVGPLFAAFVAVILAWGVKLFTSRNQFSAIYLLGGAGAVFVMSILGSDKVLALFARTSGLTGRDLLQSAWGDYFWQRPLFGYGYANFFTDQPDSPGLGLTKLTSWKRVYTTFESSYLEAGIQFGLVGSFFLGAMAVTAFYRALKQAYRNPADPAPRIMFGLLAYVAISSVSDTYLTLHNTIYPALLSMGYFANYNPNRVGKPVLPRKRPALA